MDSANRVVRVAPVTMLEIGVVPAIDRPGTAPSPAVTWTRRMTEPVAEDAISDVRTVKA